MIVAEVLDQTTLLRRLVTEYKQMSDDVPEFMALDKTDVLLGEVQCRLQDYLIEVGYIPVETIDEPDY